MRVRRQLSEGRGGRGSDRFAVGASQPELSRRRMKLGRTFHGASRCRPRTCTVIPRLRSLVDPVVTTGRGAWTFHPETPKAKRKSTPSTIAVSRSVALHSFGVRPPSNAWGVERKAATSLALSCQT